MCVLPLLKKFVPDNELELKVYEISLCIGYRVVYLLLARSTLVWSEQVREQGKNNRSLRWN